MAESLGVPKDQFLESVRQALGKSHQLPVGAIRESPLHLQLDESLDEMEARAREIRHRIAENRPALLNRLAEVAQLRGWRVCRTSNKEDAIGYVGSVATNSGARLAVRSDQEIFHEMPLDTALKGVGVDIITVARDEARESPSSTLLQQGKRDFRSEMASAGLGITGADYAVAETGSVVVLPRRGLSRLVSLLPPIHVALVRPQDVVETLDDVFLLRRLDYYRNGGDMGSYLNFITGPSRTADIEQTLIVGVHGPKEVHLVLLC